MTERTSIGRRVGRTRDRVVEVIAVLVYSNVFISLGATGVAVTTVSLADLPLEPLPLFIVFAASLFVYSLDRFVDREADVRSVPRRASYARRFGRFWLVAGVVSYVLAVLVAVVVDVPGAAYLVLPLLVAVLYSVFRLKRILLVKNLTVGLAWSAIPLGVGVYYDALGSAAVLFCAGFFLVMLTVAAVVFDIKDLEVDRTEGVRTVPLVIGPRATLIGAGACTVAVAAVVVSAVGLGALPMDFLLLLALLGYVLAYLPFASPERGALFYGFVIDGEHVFLALLVLAVDLIR